MESISELKPIFLRFFQEVDGLKQKIKEQEAEIDYGGRMEYMQK
jgi:hypothetical protein